MADWTNTALPLASLAAGSLLTMLGQGLNDRRAAKREQLARREEFRAANFEVHRSAILEMQELVRDTFKSLLTERTRRQASGENDFWESKPFGKVRELSLMTAEFLGKADPPPDWAGLTDQERGEYEDLVKTGAAEVGDAARLVTDSFKRMTDIIGGHGSFVSEFVNDISKLRLCMYRSGSNSVVYCGDKYIKLASSWTHAFSQAKAESFFDEVRASRHELDRALSNALLYGPYDRFIPDRQDSAD
jgi:hypothetical protein